VVSVANLNGDCGHDRDRDLDRHTSQGLRFCEPLSPTYLTVRRWDPILSKLQLILALTIILPNFVLAASITTITLVHIYHHPSCVSYPSYTSSVYPSSNTRCSERLAESNSFRAVTSNLLQLSACNTVFRLHAI
jgi:hypothetical protein